MAKDVFSVPIFFIVFRETIEAAIIVSVLLSFVEQLMQSGRLSPRKRNGTTTTDTSLSANAYIPAEETPAFENAVNEDTEDESVDLGRVKRIVRRMRIQIWAGTLTGFFIALCIGAAFIAVFYTEVNDLWGKTEDLWEGVFSVIAAIIIYIMGLAFLKMDRSRIKWRIKLSEAFDDKSKSALAGSSPVPEEDDEDTPAVEKGFWGMKRRATSGKWALFLLPFVTVLREGLEAVVFVGGVSLGESATSIPLAVVVGLIAGIAVGYIIYRTGSTFALHWFLIGSTCFLFLIGAGLLSKGIGSFEYYYFAHAVGSDVSESGNGPGSYNVHGNVWHLDYGNPETGAVGTNGGWQLFNAILGWNNNADIGSILGYVFYWIAIIVALIYLKWSEGRVRYFGKGSKAYYRRMARAEQQRALEETAFVAEPDDKKDHSNASASAGLLGYDQKIVREEE